jgi:hypothetical protein
MLRLAIPLFYDLRGHYGAVSVARQPSFLLPGSLLTVLTISRVAVLYLNQP